MSARRPRVKQTSTLERDAGETPARLGSLGCARLHQEEEEELQVSWRAAPDY